MARLPRQARQLAPGTEIDVISDAYEDTQIIRGLARGMAILEAFRPGDDHLSNIDIAERTGVPRSTVSRLCATLMRLGYLSYSPTFGQYALGPGILALCRSLLDNMAMRIGATPALQRLADTTHLPISLGTRDHLSILYIETARHTSARPARFDLGTRLPLATTAIGRAYLAGIHGAERAAIVDRLQSREPDADWVALRAAIANAVKSTAQNGYCYSIGEWRPDVVGVAVPVRLPDGMLLSLNCGGTPDEVSRERIAAEIGPLLVRAAADITAEIRHPSEYQTLEQESP